jgi:hypothetical protein
MIAEQDIWSIEYQVNHEYIAAPEKTTQLCIQFENLETPLRLFLFFFSICDIQFLVAVL